MSISFLHGVRGPSTQVKRYINNSQMNGGDYPRRKEFTYTGCVEIVKTKKLKGTK